MCVEGSIGCGVEYGDVVQIVVGVRMGAMWYMHALHCDGWVVCMHCGGHCRLFHWLLRKFFFGESTFLQDLFLHSLAKCIICNLFWGVFWEVATNV